MQKAPQSLRLHIGLFGRTNVGKSSFLNFVAGQDVAITSPVPGTTTDVVQKTMELLPLGPVVFLDTAGLDDISVLSDLRLKKTKKIYDASDVILLVTEPNAWTVYEDEVLKEARKRNIPVIVIVNKIDIKNPLLSFKSLVSAKNPRCIFCSSIDLKKRDQHVNLLKKYLIEVAPDEFLNPKALVGDLLPKGGLAIFIVPIDLEAPKGRLILPQVQAIRDILDHDEAVLVVKEHEYAQTLKRLKKLPDLVVCDSQVVLKMVRQTPLSVKCTTFSILFSRSKGDLLEAVQGVMALESLKPKDRILIAEACSHHPIEGDIGRVKIPRWFKEYLKIPVTIDVVAGKDYPSDLKKYKLVVHCGACMLTRRQMLFRMEKAREAGVAITNYGVCIASLQGVLGRVLSPFSNISSDKRIRKFLRLNETSLENEVL
jgi:[FeFe] hydrogenase H-cluster maturation GTPase HydF